MKRMTIYCLMAAMLFCLVIFPIGGNLARKSTSVQAETILDTNMDASIVRTASSANNKTATNFVLENGIMKLTVSHIKDLGGKDGVDSGSVEMSSLYNKTAGVEYLTGAGKKTLFSLTYVPIDGLLASAQTVNANDKNWKMVKLEGTDNLFEVRDIIMTTENITAEDRWGVNNVQMGKELVFAVSNGNLIITFHFELYNGASGLRYYFEIQNLTDSKIQFLESDSIALNFPNQAHTLHYVQNLYWRKTTGSVAPIDINNPRLPTALNLICAYDAGHGWALNPETNWKTQEGPYDKSNPKSTSVTVEVDGELKSNLSWGLPFASPSAWYDEQSNVRVTTNPSSLQLVLFPAGSIHEEVYEWQGLSKTVQNKTDRFEYINTNITVFSGDEVDGKGAVEDHFKKRFKYHDVETIFGINDWDWHWGGRRSAEFYRDVVIPLAKRAKVDMVMIDDNWNLEYDPAPTYGQLGTKDSIMPRPEVGGDVDDLSEFASAIYDEGFIFGIWYSLSGADHNQGRDLANVGMLSQKMDMIETLVTEYNIGHIMVDLTIYWQNTAENEYSGLTDNVYRKNVMTRNALNDVVNRYPQLRPKLTTEVDIYPTQGDRNVGLLHVLNNGWNVSDGGIGGLRAVRGQFGYTPLNSAYAGGDINGDMAGYYWQLSLRNSKLAKDVEDTVSWTEKGVDLMAKFTDWRKSERIKSVMNESMKYVYDEERRTNGLWQDEGINAWMYTSPNKSNALLIATNHLIKNELNMNANLRWLDKNKTYSITDITLDSNFSNSYAHKGVFTGEQLWEDGFYINLTENTDQGKAFWIEEVPQDTGDNMFVAYADEYVNSYNVKTEKGKITVNATGAPRTTGRVFVTSPSKDRGRIATIVFDKRGNGSVTVNENTLLEREDSREVLAPIKQEFEDFEKLSAIPDEATLTQNSIYTNKNYTLGSEGGSSGQLLYVGLSAIDDYITFYFNAPEAGPYNIVYGFKYHSNKGIFDVYLNDVKIRQGWDHYTNGYRFTGENLGDYQLNKGINSLKLVSTGRNPATPNNSSSYATTADYITITPSVYDLTSGDNPSVSITNLKSNMDSGETITPIIVMDGFDPNFAKAQYLKILVIHESADNVISVNNGIITAGNGGTATLRYYNYFEPKIFTDITITVKGTSTEKPPTNNNNNNNSNNDEQTSGCGSIAVSGGKGMFALIGFAVMAIAGMLLQLRQTKKDYDRRSQG